MRNGESEGVRESVNNNVSTHMTVLPTLGRNDNSRKS